jgi:hypothetical protein
MNLAELPWWVFALAALASGMGAAAFAFLGLSAGTAYGSNYHVLSVAQRRMARLLYLGSLLAALALGLLALVLGALGLRTLLG